MDFPLTSAGFLFFPDSVELDEKQKQYVLRFNSGWGIKGVETVLRCFADELRTMNVEQSPAGEVLEAAPEEPR